MWRTHVHHRKRFMLGRLDCAALWGTFSFLDFLRQGAVLSNAWWVGYVFYSNARHYMASVLPARKRVRLLLLLLKIYLHGGVCAHECSAAMEAGRGFQISWNLNYGQMSGPAEMLGIEFMALARAPGALNHPCFSFVRLRWSVFQSEWEFPLAPSSEHLVV